MDPRVLNEVLAEGRRKKATRRELLAAGVTGLVESDFENLKGGHADSSGWRQERARYYKNPTNVRAAAGRFFDEAAKHRGKKLTVGQLAQLVQRSAFPGKYQPRLKEARKLIGGAGSVKGSTRTVTATLPGGPVVDKKAALRAALASGRKNPLLEASRLIATGAYTTQGPAEKAVSSVRTAARAKRGGNGGSIGGTTNGLTPAIKGAVRGISAVYGAPMKVTSGHRPGATTTSGNVSDHASGNGADIGASGATLARMGRAALIWVGMDPKKAARTKGGAFTFHKGGRRIQIIFNSNVGGNHYDHLHVGVA